MGWEVVAFPFILHHKLLPCLCYHFASVNGKSVAELFEAREHPLYLSAAPIDFSSEMTLLVTGLSPCWGHLQLFPVWIGNRAVSCLYRAPGELFLAWNLAKIIMHLQV